MGLEFWLPVEALRVLNDGFLLSNDAPVACGFESQLWNALVDVIFLFVFSVS